MGAQGADESSTTRYLETTRGTLSYSQVADIVADHLAVLLDRIALGEFADRPIAAALVQEFHYEILAPIVPAIAGKWRPVDVTVGKHLPPRWYEVPTLMHNYALNLDAQVAACGGAEERQIEALAYAEGHMLTIHPFEDFNGRAVRAFITEILRRLDMPPIEVSVERNTQQFEDYKLCLRAFDEGNPQLLREFWVARFEDQIEVLLNAAYPEDNQYP